MGSITYAAFELIYWSSVPIVAWRTSIYPSGLSSIISSSDGDGTNLALLMEASKLPFLVAVILWPNSWLRNGIVVRLAEMIISLTGMDVNEDD